ncbi:MAG: A/G-specific adenine glycosylase [Alphaproteobacteria bacterium]|nr:A/G-specific adenine glycosylase [Alphaproteobacteria bacterium]MDP6875796.1 A/G-specific adenine glycosylase [Alphaproteobacteria bacterium]
MLAWYDQQHRKLPWRAAPGVLAEPYHVWLSEIMLQQTVVKTVIPYYGHFLSRWPTVEALAAAELDQVLHAWQGLGYYARARNLHKCAQAVVAEHGGCFPETEVALRGLPGIGPYTAAAIAAIAFGRKASPVDGNIERVVARLFAVTEPLPGAKAELRRLAAGLTPDRRAGDHAQALMDLGATVCLPRAPLCERCPLSDVCAGHRQAIAAELPKRRAKAARPTRYGTAFCLFDRAGRLLLRRRPERGLLGGMMEVPSTPWQEVPWRADEIDRHAPLPAEWETLPGGVVHVFTHFRLELSVRTATGQRAAKSGEIWQAPEDLGNLALPSVMKKVLRHALAD